MTWLLKKGSNFMSFFYKTTLCQTAISFHCIRLNSLVIACCRTLSKNYIYFQKRRFFFVYFIHWTSASEVTAGQWTADEESLSCSVLSLTRVFTMMARSFRSCREARRGQRDELNWDFLSPHPGVGLSRVTSSVRQNTVEIIDISPQHALCLH